MTIVVETATAVDVPTIWIRGLNGQGIYPLDLTKSGVRKILVDWNGFLGMRKSTTITTSTWTTEDAGTASVATATNEGGITGINITAVDEGATAVTNKIVLANGETLVRKFWVRVVDPMVGRINDYQ